ATTAQKCSGPSSTTQSGRATVTPGINARPQKQTIAATIHLFQCAPSTLTGGSGTFKPTITTTTAFNCALINNAQTLHASATIWWKSTAHSTLSLTVKTSGPGRLANVTGKVTAGLFTNHLVSGQFHFKPVVSPNGHTVAQACANTVAPGGAGRI